MLTLESFILIFLVKIQHRFSAQMETIAEEYSEGVVTKALQRGHGNKRRDFEKNGWAQCVNGVISSTDPSSESGATLKYAFVLFE
jgi:hypothetical protein